MSFEHPFVSEQYKPNSLKYFLKERDAICNVFLHAEAVDLGDIDAIRPDLIGQHSNKIQMIELPIPSEDISTHSNEVHLFTITSDSLPTPIQGLFKPQNGENESRLREFDIKQMYLREVAAYQIDYHAGLGIVPPTVKRSINGEIGSLQLYIPPSLAKSGRQLGTAVDKDKLHSGIAWKKIALLDALSSNADRDDSNYLVGTEDNSQAVAIDHGCAFCRVRIDDKNEPGLYFAQHPDEAFLDPELRECLERLLSARSVLLPDDEIIEVSDEANLMKIYDVFSKAEQMLATNSLLLNQKNASQSFE